MAGRALGAAHRRLRCCHSPHALPPAPRRSSSDDGDDDEDLSNNKIVQFCKSLFTFTDQYDGDKFFTVRVRPRAFSPVLFSVFPVCVDEACMIYRF